MFVYHADGYYTFRTNTRDSWLIHLANGDHNPKPPEWWLESQALGPQPNPGRHHLVVALQLRPQVECLVTGTAQ